jgi:hypothetical protein
VKQIPPTDSWHQVDSDRCNFHPHASINPCFTAGKISGVGNCHAAWRHKKTTVRTSIVKEVKEGLILEEEAKKKHFSK